MCDLQFQQLLCDSGSSSVLVLPTLRSACSVRGFHAQKLRARSFFSSGYSRRPWVRAAAPKQTHIKGNFAADVVPTGTTIPNRNRARASFTAKNTRTSASGGKKRNGTLTSRRLHGRRGLVKNARRETIDVKSRENQAETLHRGKEEGNVVVASCRSANL